MAEREIIFLGISEAAQLIRQGDLSPVALTEAFFDRIERIDGQVNSFLTLDKESAVKSAQQAEEEIRQGQTVSGKPPGRLHGIPLGLKDLYETANLRTTLGAKFYADHIPGDDAGVVTRLKDAGAIILGKNNMHEIALGLTNINPHYGPSRNPWALDRITGGSSGGSAAAVVASLCMGSLGSDTGGSIRVPAGLCGIVGLKPTYGRVSLRGVLPLSWNLDHAGPIARSVIDVALLLQEIAGYDPLDPYSIAAPVDDYTGDIRSGVAGWRIAFMVGEYFERTDPAVMQAVQTAAQVFTELGANVEEVELPQLRQAARASGMMVISDAAAVHHDRIKESPEDFGTDVLQRLQFGAATDATTYILARRTQTVMRWEFARFFESYDLILMPTTIMTAAPIDGLDALEQARYLTRFTSPFNLTGLPAISLPCGFDYEGLPVGLQIIAPAWAEARLLRGAYAFEQNTNWHQQRPPV